MSASEPTPARGGTVSRLWRLLAVAAAGALLFLLAYVFLEAPCLGLFPVVALVAWPLWYHRREVVLFERRAVLAGVATRDGWVRRRFWAGHLTQVLQVFVALAWATLLLALASLLGPEHWAVLAADVLFLSLIIDPVQRRVGGQVQADKVGAFSRRWPLFAINLVFLTLAFLLVDFFVAGAPDTRGMPWHAVAEETFRQFGLGAGCAPAGWLVGVLATVEQLAWHASQLVIPSLPDPTLKLAAWTVVLAQAGLVAYLYTRLQLGVVAMFDRTAGAGDARGGDTFSLAFFYTILFLAVPYLYAALKLADLDPRALQAGAERVVAWANPCDTEPAARAALLGALGDDLARARAQAQAEADRAVDAALDALFADVEEGVDRYLDWYFTVIGEYERLAASVAGDFGALMSEQLETHLFGDTRFAERLEAASDAIEASSASAMAAAAGRLGERAAAEVKSEPCRLDGVSLHALGDLERDRMRAAMATTGGAAAGVVTAKLLAKNAGAMVAGKVAAKKGFKVAAGIAGKVAAKKGGSILLSATAATALCAPTGPMAVLCGVVAGTVTWLTIDKAMVEIDEALFRDEMRAELLETVAEQRAALADALRMQHAAAIDGYALQIHNRLEGAFVPARDGM